MLLKCQCDSIMDINFNVGGVKLGRLYVGTVKICKSNRVNEYIKEGENSIKLLFQCGSMSEGVLVSNISDTFEDQFLIKLRDNNYFWIKGKKVIGLKPTESNNIFIVEESLKNNQDTKKMIKSLKR